MKKNRAMKLEKVIKVYEPAKVNQRDNNGKTKVNNLVDKLSRQYSYSDIYKFLMRGYKSITHFNKAKKQHKLGRKFSYSNDTHKALISLYRNKKNNKLTNAQIMKKCNVSREQFYYMLKRFK